MGWTMPWYTLTDSFDLDFGVDQWHGHNAFIRDGERMFRTYFINTRGDEAIGTVWSFLDMTALGRQEEWEESPKGYPQSRTYKWWNWHDSYVPGAAPDPKWVEVSDAGEAAFRKHGSIGWLDASPPPVSRGDDAASSAALLQHVTEQARLFDRIVQRHVSVRQFVEPALRHVPFSCWLDNPF